MIHSLMLLASGIVMLLWRPCRSREGRAPRLAVALLLASTAAVWLGSFGVLVGVLSGRLIATPAACGILWQQLLAGELSWWHAGLATAWLLALPGRGLWAVMADIRRTRRLLRGLVPAGTILTDRCCGKILVVPSLSTPAVTVGLLRPVIAVDEGWWASATNVERDVVLAHERGHIRGGHGFLDAAARFLVAGIAPLPGAAEAYACLRRHLEALADDAAARRHGQRTVGVALGRIALAAYPTVGLGSSGASEWRVRRLVTVSQLGWRDRALLWSMLASVAVGLVLTMAEAAHALGPVINASYCVVR